MRLALQPFYKLLAGLSGLAIFAIMVITSIDVLGRYFFSHPLLGSIEISEFLMLLTGFPAFIFMQDKGMHLNVDMVYQKFTDKTKAAFRVFWMTLSIPYMFILAHQIFITAADKMEFEDTTEILGLLLWPAHGFVAVCMVILGICMLLNLLSYWHEASVLKNTGGAAIAFAIGIAMFSVTYAACGHDVGLSPGAIGGLDMLLLFLLIICGMPIGCAMIIAGTQGLLMLSAMPDMAFGLAACAPYPQVASFTMTVIPMFVLMGELALFGNVSKGLFEVASNWLGHLPGGLAIATVCGCAGFAAVCGDSIATAMTMATVSLPEMQKNGYDEAFGASCLSVGGTLGILIPPSMGFIMYAVVTEESVGKLFMAGIMPGILLTCILCGTIWFRARMNPKLAPRGERCSWKLRMSSLYKMLPMVALFTLIMGGILVGFCTPTEGGAIGALGCLIFCIITRNVDMHKLFHALIKSAELCGKLFFILVGVGIMGYMLASSNLPTALSDLIAGSGIGKYALLISILLLYTILGMLMNVIPMILLILPAIFPSVVAAGFDPVWFGVITVLMMELGQITPPVGVLVFAMAGVIPHVPMFSIFKHVFIFYVAILICVALLIIFPQICLFLPSTM
ncbi:MAG: TRAP transporter large permease subunit [Mailhella sp.]|nr:TRAP transporter large permease subunit [Mailhella sp.]